MAKMHRCTVCGNVYPHTEEYFYRKDAKRLCAHCKSCHGKAPKSRRNVKPAQTFLLLLDPAQRTARYYAVTLVEEVTFEQLKDGSQQLPKPGAHDLVAALVQRKERVS